MTETFRLPELDGWLDFEEGPWAGARVRVRLSTPLSLYLDILEGMNTGKGRVFAVSVRKWADQVLMSWNITLPDGTAVPATAEGIMQLPPSFVPLIVHAWLNKVPEVELPLGRGSPAGATSDD